MVYINNTQYIPHRTRLSYRPIVLSIIHQNVKTDIHTARAILYQEHFAGQGVEETKHKTLALIYNFRYPRSRGITSPLIARFSRKYFVRTSSPGENMLSSPGTNACKNFSPGGGHLDAEGRIGAPQSREAEHRGLPSPKKQTADTTAALRYSWHTAEVVLKGHTRYTLSVATFANTYGVFAAWGSPFTVPPSRGLVVRPNPAIKEKHEYTTPLLLVLLYCRGRNK